MKRIFLYLVLSILSCIPTLVYAQDTIYDETIHLKGVIEKQLVLSSYTKDIFLEGCKVQCDTSYAIIIQRKKNVNLHIIEGTENFLGDAGIKCRGNLIISGNGSLSINAKNDGHKGIRVKKNLTIQDNPNITIITSGKALKQEEETPPQDMAQGGDMMKGPMGGPMGGMPSGMQGDSLHHNMPFPNPPAMNGDSLHQGMQFPNPPEGGGAPMVRYDYTGATKALKVMGNALVLGGNLTIKTSTPGAEGFEVKDTLIIKDGKIDVEAYDDGINVGTLMIVEGGNINVLSTNNDAIDVNGEDMQNVRYIQTGGNVVAKTTAGPPEEALDTDNTPIQQTGGTLRRDPEQQQFEKSQFNILSKQQIKKEYNTK